MKHSDDLFQLIKSLTQTEKRYFKLFASLSNKKGANNYIKLFNAIDCWGEKEYDEVVLKAKLKNYTFAKQLHVTKNYLYALLLKSLRNYYNISSESKIQEYLKESEILFRKALYKQCDKMIQKAEDYANQSEMYTYLYEIYKFQEKLLHFLQLNPKLELEKSIELENKRRHDIRLLVNQNEYKDAFLKMQRWTKQYGREVRSKEAEWRLTEIISNPLLQDPSQALSFESLRFYYRTLTKYYVATADLQKSYEMSCQLMVLHEESPLRIRNGLGVYISILHDHIILCINLKKYEDLKNTYEKLKKISGQFDEILTEAQKYELQLILFVNELIYYNTTQEFIKGAEVIKKNLNAIPQFGKIYDQRLIGTYYFIAYTYFLNKNYKPSLQWANKIVLSFHDDKSRQTQCNVRILKVILYYELQDLDMMEYAVKSCYRFLLKKNRLNDSEKILLNALRKLPEVTNNKELQVFFKDLLHSFELCNDTLYNSYYTNLNLVGWLKSKLV